MNLYTQKLSSIEKEVDLWYEVFESFSDEEAQVSLQQPSENCLNHIKSFARAYESLAVMNEPKDLILN